MLRMRFYLTRSQLNSGVRWQWSSWGEPFKEASVHFPSILRPLALPAAITTIGACLSCNTPRAAPPAGLAPRNDGLILQSSEGERRVRRNAGKGPFIIKVDRQNGGSPDLVMGYEDIAPGAEIQLHRHLIADEILFVHRGTGTASLNGRRAHVSAGATIYVPRNVTIGLVNDGTEPLGITFTFSRPGFEELMRDNSVLEGQPVTPMSEEERARIQAKHRWHTIAGPPPQ
jgi:quercetin dioxygenase-like cupin family protein